MDPVTIVPEIDDLGILDHKSQTQVKRKVSNAMRKGGVLHRLMRQRSLARQYRLVRTLAKAGRLGSMSRVVAAGPVALAAAAIALVGAVALRLTTGKTFGQMGEVAEEFIFGDAGPDARAAIDARAAMTGNRLALQAIRSGDPNVKKSYDMLKHMALLRHKGERQIKKDIGVNNLADMVILRGADAFTEHFARNGTLDRWRQATMYYRAMMPLGFTLAGKAIRKARMIF
jgi:hypothetical protein